MVGHARKPAVHLSTFGGPGDVCVPGSARRADSVLGRRGARWRPGVLPGGVESDEGAAGGAQATNRQVPDSHQDNASREDA